MHGHSDPSNDEKSPAAASSSHITAMINRNSSSVNTTKQLEVPKIIHLIWAGGEKFLPTTYINSMLLWQAKNPAWEINLWVDESSSGTDILATYPKIFEGTAKKLQLKSSSEKINLLQIKMVDIEGVDANITFNNDENWKIANKFVRYELDRIRSNYGTSSDLLRYRLLYQFGGAYFDFDVKPGNMSLEDIVNTNKSPGHHLWLYPFSQNSKLIGNDAFICTPKNPYIAFIYAFAENSYRIGTSAAEKEKVFRGLQRKALELGILYDPDSNEAQGISSALNLGVDVYSYDSKNYIFGFTPIKTGPSCVRAAVSSIIQSDNNVLSSVDSSVHLLQRENLQPFEHSGLEWTNPIPVRHPTVLKAAEVSFKTLVFEIDHFGYLRLDSHFDDIVASTNCSYLEAIEHLLSILDGAHIDYKKVRAAQLTFQHPETVAFYNKHSIDTTKTLLFPADQHEISDYQHPILKILSISELNAAQDSAEIIREEFSLESKEESDLQHKIMRGLRFFEFAATYYQNKLNSNNLLSEQKVDAELSTALYLDFVLDQALVYQNILHKASETIPHSDTIKNMLDNLTQIQTKLLAMLEPYTSYINKKPQNEDNWDITETDKTILKNTDIEDEIDWDDDDIDPRSSRPGCE